jgi:hypothetical protein
MGAGTLVICEIIVSTHVAAELLLIAFIQLKHNRPLYVRHPVHLSLHLYRYVSSNIPMQIRKGISHKKK